MTGPRLGCDPALSPQRRKIGSLVAAVLPFERASRHLLR